MDDKEGIWIPPYDPNLDWINWQVERFWEEVTIQDMPRPESGVAARRALTTGGESDSHYQRSVNVR